MKNEEELKKFEKPLRKPLGKLVERCEKGGIEYEWGPGLKGRHALLISIEKGGGKRGIYVFGVDGAKALLDSGFEKYAFVEGYAEAICCCGEGYAEAIVWPIGPRASKAVILGRLTGATTYKDFGEIMRKMKRGVDVRMVLAESGGKGVKVSIGKASKDLLAMVRFLEGEGALSVRVEGLEIGNREKVSELLGRVVNSTFFELRRKRGIELFIRKEHGLEALTWGSNPWVGGEKESDLEFPKLEYDKEAIELYWHAVGAYKMPLLQYLGYYQVLESYFVKYSTLNTKGEGVGDGKDIAEIGTSASKNTGLRGGEKDLLCSTIQGCISKEELISKLSNPLLNIYFEKLYKKVSRFKVSEDNEDIDIREQLAERIYDIRCKIVHTKEGDRRGRISPFTEEEELLELFDLPMIAGLADNALTGNSRELSF